MAQNYAIHVSKAKEQRNNAGGTTHVLDCWKQLDRFLIFGCSGNTYYCSEQEMTRDNARCIEECLKQDPEQTVRRIVEISREGRAPKNDPAIFALALCSKHPAALAAIPLVCRTATHLFQFVGYIETAKLRGWGSGLRRGVSRWYQQKKDRDLSYQLVKYQNREKWTHRDLLRLCHLHPSTISESASIALQWALRGWEGVGEAPHPDEALLPIWAFERAKKATSVQEIVALIRDYRLVRECIPTQFLNAPEVWEALLEEMPMEAMLRNLGKMTQVGLLKPLSKASKLVWERLQDEERIRKARLHPLKILVAANTYNQGQGVQGNLSWTPVQMISSGLEIAFYMAFKNVEPTNKRWLYAVDVSGSMNKGTIAGMPGVTPRVGAAALSLVLASTEPQYAIYGFSTRFLPLNIKPGQLLNPVVNYMNSLPFGGTDCSLPMIEAARNNWDVDAFVVLTDNETWDHDIRPSEALRRYRDKMGIAAKLIVIGMTATKFTIADPEDLDSLDVVGFDSSIPEILNQFVLQP